MIPIFDCPPATFKARVTPATAIRIDFKTGAVTDVRVWTVTHDRQLRSFDTLGEACDHVREVVR